VRCARSRATVRLRISSRRYAIGWLSPSARPRVDWARVWRRVALAPALGLLTVAVWWGWQAQQLNAPINTAAEDPTESLVELHEQLEVADWSPSPDAELLHQHRVHPMRAAFLLTALVWTLGWAQERPVQWLQRAQQAEETLAVAGARVVEITAGRTVQRIEERFWRQGARAERIEVLAPPERRGEVLLYRGGRWLAMRPNAKEAFEMPRMPIQGALLLKTAVELVQRGVVLAETLPDAAVLGRSCVVVRLTLARPALQHDDPPRPLFPAAVSPLDRQGDGLRAQTRNRPAGRRARDAHGTHAPGAEPAPVA
jgi:hypothetical protein